jgi:hypothetical protein
MPSSYVTTDQAQGFGLSGVTTAQIAAASALIDAFLKRPEGLAWLPDSNGNPAYMAGADPDLTFTLASSISPGTNVSVTLNGPASILQVGDILVLGTDIENSTVIESCVVATTTLPNGSPSITLSQVQFAHAGGAKALHGLVIEEMRYCPRGRPIIQISRAPLVNFLSGVGRYAFGRRGDTYDEEAMEYFNLLASLQKFGGPPSWELFQPTLSQNWDPQTGQLWIPAGVLLAYYSEVKVRYVAGFPATSIPASVQAACVSIIGANTNLPALGQIKSFAAGDTKIQMAAASLMSDDVKAMLSPYHVRSFY